MSRLPKQVAGAAVDACGSAVAVHAASQWLTSLGGYHTYER